ncbi:DUF2892 domain-containing protein [Stappia indica]|uniref:DUF2892 domain-containing protein n=1 Tax=Stappia indica TaxID=538381 RepID=A0A857CGG5_9HYPH|nr:DUF2892 domain-containing protein [Stappia indica]QGZ37552.1 DUF2892 domain-containing protein [Stappia indica]
MTTNVGSADRIARIVVGLALIAFALSGPADITWKWVGWIGVVPLLTAFLKWCPAYTLLGVNTCSK